VTAPVSTGAFFSGTVLVEPYNARRQDNITVLDLRTEKVVEMARNMRLRLFLDVFLGRFKGFKRFKRFKRFKGFKGFKGFVGFQKEGTLACQNLSPLTVHSPERA
jgi:hypothetical protein